MKRSINRLSLIVFVGVLLAGVSQAAAQTAGSAPLAQELARLMAEGQLDSIAARDPNAPDAFVAALYFAGQQLLVVSAQYQVPELLEKKIAAREYRDVYIDLQSASLPDSKVFVTDLNADGLKVRGDDSDPFDSVDQQGASITFDNNWRRQQNMSEEDFRKAFSEADAKYAHMLEVLVTGIKARTSS